MPSAFDLFVVNIPGFVVNIPGQHYKFLAGHCPRCGGLGDRVP